MKCKSIIKTNSYYTNIYGKKMGRSLYLTEVGIIVSALIAINKLFLGILSLSLFTCVNALYSVGMVVARIIALTGIRKTEHKREQNKYYVTSGIVLIFSSFLYIIYSMHLLYNPITSSFHHYVAIGIAAVTFTEIGMNVRGVLLTRHSHIPLFYTIKMINLSSSLIAIVLTQTALLSFSGQEVDLLKVSKSNGIIGIIMGSVSIMIGVYTLFFYKIKKDI